MNVTCAEGYGVSGDAGQPRGEMQCQPLGVWTADIICQSEWFETVYFVFS